MKRLVIDFETKDPYIKRGLGSGWVYGINVPSSDFKVLGAALLHYNGFSEYEVDMRKVAYYVDQHDVLVMHNAEYDFGCLLYLVHLGLLTRESLRSKIVVDTVIMAKLYNNEMPSYHLNDLSKKFLGVSKESDKLGECMAALLPENNYPTKKLNQLAMENMDILQSTFPDVVASYAVKDASNTLGLYLHFEAEASKDMWETILKYSKLVTVCCFYREKGVRVDLKAARETQEALTKKLETNLVDMHAYAGRDFNPNSSQQLSDIFRELGTMHPTTELGNPSITKELINNLASITTAHQPFFQLLNDYKKIYKILNSFIAPILDVQAHTCPGAVDVGKVYPVFTVLGATRTGRMTCSTPNLQQIPARDKELAPLCRRLFLPDEGELWYSIDYSNQEGRLQMHYASLLGCAGADELCHLWQQDPLLDIHQKVADMAGITRDQAKTVNLGLSYGMGIYKLANTLKVNLTQARDIQNKYKRMVPYLASLSQICQYVMETRQKLKTLGGRFLQNEPSKEYKALNKLIQGSAADQLYMAMLDAHEAGLNIKLPIHDQLCVSGTAEDAYKLAKIMDTGFKLNVPVVVDFVDSGGASWGAAGH
jgi:DNA polymerase-1